MPFDEFGLAPVLLRAIKEMGYTEPTPIQRQAIPHVLAGRDLIGLAQTGTGKTAAFLLPILQRLLARPRGSTRVLILAPTRELALQSDEFVRDLGRFTPIRGAPVFGGVGMAPQETALRRGIDIITATPGRLLDHFERRNPRFENLEVLVIDEADRMMDMGFLPDLRRILAKIPARRQTLLFSATMPNEILQLTRQILRDPVTVQVGTRSAPATGITHAAFPVPAHLKAPLLIALLKRSGRDPALESEEITGTERRMETTLVFTRTKHRADRLTRILQSAGVKVAAIHGNRSQNQRVQALEGFKYRQYQVLVATDIVSRGIDVVDISHVVNYDVPHTPDEYVHRIGRSARATATGVAFSLVSPEEEKEMRDIERRLARVIPRLAVPGFDYTAAPPPKSAQQQRQGGRGGRGQPGAGRRGRPGGGGRGSGGRRGRW